MGGGGDLGRNVVVSGGAKIRCTPVLELHSLQTAIIYKMLYTIFSPDIGRIHSDLPSALERSLTFPAPKRENPSSTIRSRPPGMTRTGFGGIGNFVESSGEPEDRYL